MEKQIQLKNIELQKKQELIKDQKDQKELEESVEKNKVEYLAQVRAHKMKKEQFLLEKQQIENVQLENQKLIAESHQRVMSELTKSESND